MTTRDIERLAMVGHDTYQDATRKPGQSVVTWQELGPHQRHRWLVLAAQVLNGEVETAAAMRACAMEGYAEWSWPNVSLRYRIAWERVRTAMLRARDAVWATQGKVAA